MQGGEIGRRLAHVPDRAHHREADQRSTDRRPLPAEQGDDPEQEGGAREPVRQELGRGEAKPIAELAEDGQRAKAAAREDDQPDANYSLLVRGGPGHPAIVTVSRAAEHTGGRMSPEAPRWAMDVVFVCSVTPPPDVLRQAVDEVSGEGSAIGDENGRPLVTVETDAPDAAAAVQLLEAKTQQLVQRLSRYECLVQRTDRLQDRSPEGVRLQSGSIG